MRLVLSSVLALLLFGLEACGDSGEQRLCTCAGGGIGVQERLPGDLGWSECACACQPECGQRDCGPDPLCGLNCGMCGASQHCDDGGRCVSDCPALSCEGLECGRVENDCGGTLDCGDCQEPMSCGAGGIPHFCGCTPVVCAQNGGNCGIIPDGCGGSLDCGDCATGTTCGGGGLAHVCESEQVVMEPVCNEAGWCWQHPRPQGNDLNRSWVFSPTNVWMIGDAGTILHWDGAVWRSSPSGTTRSLNGLWASGPDDIWAAGDMGVLLHFDGERWQPVETGTLTKLRGIWGSGPEDIWVVGHSSFVLHYDGSSWSEVSLEDIALLNFMTVWGSGPDDVWILGDAIFDWGLHFDGESWTRVDLFIGSPNAFAMYDLWGSGPDDVYAVGAFGRMLHWDGLRWTLYEMTGGQQIHLSGVWGSGPDDVWVVGDFGILLHFDGANWSDHGYGSFSLTSVRGDGSGELWVSGCGGEMARKQGAGFVSQTRRHGIGILSEIRRIGAEQWAVGGYGDLLCHNGTSWSNEASLAFEPLWGIWGAWPKDIWAVGANSSLLRRDGSTWTALQAPEPTHFKTVWGASAEDVWIAGSSGLYHYTGAGLEKVPLLLGSSGLFQPGGLWGASSRDVWVVGLWGDIFHFAGDRWIKETIEERCSDLKRVSGSAADDVWAVGCLPLSDAGPQKGCIMHFDGDTWTRTDPERPGLWGVWAESRQNAWAVGDGGTILHFDGDGWHEIQAGTNRGLRGVFGDTRGMWVVGAWSAILHRPN